MFLTRRLARPCALVLILAASICLHSAHAATWTGGGGDGKWSTAGNWLNSAPPSTNGETVTYDLNSTAQLTAGIYDLTLTGLTISVDTTFVGTAITINGATPTQTLSLSSVTLGVTALPVTFTLATPVATSATQSWNINGNTLTLTPAATVLLASGTLTVSGLTTGVVNFGGSISGSSGALTLSTGSAALSADNSYGGLTTVSSGTTLVLGHANALGGTGGATTVLSGGAVDLKGQTIAESLTLDGTGVASSGAIFNSSTTEATVSGSIVTGAGAAYTVNCANAITLSGQAGSTTATLTKAGAGTLTLSGSTANTNLFLVVSAGTAVLAKASSSSVHAVKGQTAGSIQVPALIVNSSATAKIAGSGTNQLDCIVGISSGGTLDLNGNDVNLTGFRDDSTPVAPSNYTGTITDNSTTAGTSTVKFSFASVNTNIYNGYAIKDGAVRTIAVTSATGNVANTHTFANANSNYSGGLTVSQGYVYVTAASAVDGSGLPTTGPLGRGTVTVTTTNAAANVGGSIRFSVASTIGNNFVVAGRGEGIGALRFDANITINGSINMTAFTRFVGNSGQTVTLKGAITGVGSPEFFSFQNTTTYVLNNTTATPNSWSGNATVTVRTFGINCTLKLAAANQIPDSVGVVLYSSGTGIATLDLAGFSDTIGGISGVGVINTSAAGTPTLTFGGNNADANFNGTISNTAGTLSLIKNGTGKQTLYSTNTYSGSLTINAGTVAVSSTASVAYYSFDGFTVGNAIPDATTITNGGTGGAAMNGVVSGANASAITGKFNEAVALTQSSQTSIDIANSIVNLSGGTSWTVCGWVRNPTANSTILSKGDSKTSFATGNTALGLGNSSTNLSGSKMTGFRSGNTTFGNTGSSNVSNSDGNWHFFAFVNAAGNKNVLTESTGGMWPASTSTAGVDNWGTGATDVGNTVWLGLCQGAFPTGHDSGINFIGGLDEIRFFNVALSNAQLSALVNSNSLTSVSTGLPTAGAITIAAGATLDLSGLSSQTFNAISGSGTIALGASALTLSTSTGITFDGAITGTGTLTKSGTGTLTLNGISTYSGSTTVGAGTLSGTGTLSNSTLLVTGGTLSPGLAATPGTFSALNADFSGGGTLLVRVPSASQSGVDLLSLSGMLTMGGTSKLTINLAGHPGTASELSVAQSVTWSAGSGFPKANVTFQNQGVNTAAVSYSAGSPDKVLVAINQGVTPLRLVGIVSRTDGAGVIVSWDAQSEFQNLGFNVYRSPAESNTWTRVNPVLIPGRISNPDYKSYQSFDWPPAGIYRYKLECIGLDGRPDPESYVTDAVVVDPSVPTTASAMGGESAVAGLTRSGTTRPTSGTVLNEGISGSRNTIGAVAAAAQKKRAFARVLNLSKDSDAVASRGLSESATAVADAAPRWFSAIASNSSSSFTAAKVMTGSRGVLLISPEQLPAGFDLRRIAIQREGRVVTPLGFSGSSLAVFAPGYQDEYTNKDALFLRAANVPTQAPSIPRAQGLFDSARSADTISEGSVTQEYHDVYFDYGLPRPYSYAPWFSNQYLTTGTVQRFTFDLPRALSSAATLTVNLWSLTNTPHSLAATINGRTAGEAAWSGGGKMMQLSFAVDAATLVDGANTIELSTSGTETQTSLLHSMTLTFTRALDTAVPIEIRNTSGSEKLFEVSGLPGPDAWVVDARFADRAALVASESRAQSDGTWRLRFVAPSGGAGLFHVVPFGQENQPLSVSKRIVKPLRAGAYLATGPAQFSSSVQPLLAQHAKEGLRSSFADQEQLFDYYNHGRYGPRGIQNAVRATRPAYLLLVGRTTYDYLNSEGQNTDPLCPTFLVPTTFWAQATSDSMFGDLGRGYPEVAIGRLPVNNTTELAGAVRHVLAYHGPEQSGIRLHAAADHDDPDAGAFGAQADTIAASNPEFSFQRNYLGTTRSDSAGVTSALAAAANGGADWLLYVGHGNASRLGKSAPRILDVDTVQTWTGNAVFLQSTCTAHWMAKNDNTYRSIAIQALTQPQGGISAGIGTSTYMNSDVAVAFMNELLKNTSGSTRWGDALLKTQRWALGTGGTFNADLGNTEQLFGDPAMRIFAKKSTAAKVPVMDGSF